MTEVLVLPVPEALPALYLVPGSMSHDEAERLVDVSVASRVAEPLRRLTRVMFGTPGLAVAIRPLADFTTFAGPACGDIEVVAFASRIEPRPGPLHEWVTRAAAGSLAAELGLPVLDCFAKAMADPGEVLASLPGSPDLAGVAGGFRLADWVVVERTGPSLLTRGLRRFGLPEIMVAKAAPELHASWCAVLLAVGAKVLEYLRCALRGGEPGVFLELPAVLGIGRRDISVAYGTDVTGAGPVLPVRLAVEPVVAGTLTSYLSVHGPTDLSVARLTSGAVPPGRRNRRAAAARTRAGAAKARRRT